MYHHTKTKGDLAVFKAQASLCEQGYMICVPATEHAPFDLVAYKNNIFYRIQVKYRKCHRGNVTVQFSNSLSYPEIRRVPVDLSQIDLYCIYCPDTDECYFFDPIKFGGSVSLRIKPSKKSNKTIKLAKDFTHADSQIQ